MAKKDKILNDANQGEIIETRMVSDVVTFYNFIRNKGCKMCVMF